MAAPRSTPGGDDFPSTQWSLVARAGGKREVARDALAQLCAHYWYPVYALFRRLSSNVQEAEDLSQGFFAHLLDGELVAAADPEAGRFRSYLAGCCKNYMRDRHRRSAAKKRGGSYRRVPIDFIEAEKRFRREPSHVDDPERLFVRNWAFALIEQAEKATRQSYARAGRGDLFDRLRPTIAGDPAAERYRAIAAEFGISENVVKKTVQQIRQRYSSELRRRIAQTIIHPGEVDDEIRELFAAVRGE